MLREHSAKPLVRWAGGKRFLLPILRQILPTTYKTYYEPFCGGAALFFDLAPQSAVLNDANEELINLYTIVRNEPSNLIKFGQTLINSEKEYYCIRSWQPTNNVERAARLLYLCKLSFNGVYRVNRQGEFNIAYGKRPHLQPFSEQDIKQASRILTSAVLTSCDYLQITKEIKKDDLVYFDPPYSLEEMENQFVHYTSKLFTYEDQIRLSRECERLRKIGATVIISNAEHPSIRRLYPSFTEMSVQRYSGVAASKKDRKQISESLYISNVN
jgi:DNA adenine methylase